jgi:hypothetical protein
MRLNIPASMVLKPERPAASFGDRRASSRFMSLFIGFIVFLLSSSFFGATTAMANYLVIASGFNRVEYVELDTARRTQVGYLIVVVEDYFHPDLLGHLSRLRLQEIDCQKARMRVRLERRYSGKRGTGRPTAVIRQPEAGWTPLASKGELGKLLRGQFCTG